MLQELIKLCKKKMYRFNITYTNNSVVDGPKNTWVAEVFPYIMGDPEFMVKGRDLKGVIKKAIEFMKKVDV